MDDYLKLTASRRLTRQIMGAERDFEHADYLFQPSFSPADNLPSDDILYRAFHPALNLATIHLHRFGI
ncbi:hypothetical protein D5R40_33200 [Okeania hirsuta]|uniref:Uncharacterized protein n=1 Tax=Okeania hirsuta TaxID=1458930 RepID=A0A3N6P5I9_9CYAN|nr:hypothetical protein D5R40_33200 [Okeania hirsuta]